MNRSSAIRIIVLAAIVAVALFVAIRFDAPALLRDLLAWIAAQGFTGMAVFIGVYIMATVFFVPGSILTLGAGFVYGVAVGTALVSVASTIGAFAAFLVGRYVARDWVAGRAKQNPRFGALDRATGREGWKIVLLTRLSPIFPFNMLNYTFGLTSVGAGPYFFFSWIGMLPGTVMYVYFGSLAANIATLGEGGTPRGPLQWLFYGLGLIATVAVTVVVTRVARAALRDALDDDPRPTAGA